MADRTSSQFQQMYTDPTARAGMSYNELISTGFTPLEAATAASGFSQAFGGGRAQQYRQQAGLTDTGIVQQYAAPTLPQYQQTQITNPQLPAGTEFTPEMITPQAGEFIDPNAYNIQQPITAAQPAPIGQVSTIQGTQAAAPQAVDAEAIAAGVSTDSATYDPTLTTAVDPMQAAQGAISEMATVQGQLKQLYSDFDEAAPPAWAQGAINKAESVMSARGLGASSIATTAIVQAVQEQAINIAATDASSYFQMDMTNLNNRQQANLVNFQARQQNMLTDTSIQNAASQFNAQSMTQVEQFTAQLIGNIKMQNQQLTTQVETFNAAEENKIAAQNVGNEIEAAKFDKNMEMAVSQYNAGMEFNRQQFNSNMSATIDQANVQWRRNLNTANTASINAANQANVMNKYNLSSVSMNNMWQAFRDEAAWAFTASENEKQRTWNTVQAANNRQFNSRNDETWLSDLGEMGGQWFGKNVLGL